jgi:hypothetical protein
MQSFKAFGEYVLANSRHGENPSTWVHIIVNYPKIKWDDWAEYMATLTWFSGIPLTKGGSKNAHVIFAETIDEALAQCDKYSHAIISYIGTFYYSDHTENIFTYFEKFCKSDHACRGHLLFHPDKPYGRLHPQTIFLNVDHWRKIGKPSFGNYTGKVMLPERSMSNVHDDYTPHWIKPSTEYAEVTDCEQAEYISRVLEDGKTILNLDGERRTKFFCYPERRHSIALDSERNRNSNIVYARNNESYPDFNAKFDVIYAPASGNIAEKLMDEFGHKSTQLIIYDYNEDSIKWKRLLYNMQNIEKVNLHFKSKKDCILDDCSYKPDLLKQSLDKFSDEKWLQVIKQTSPTIIKYDIINDGPFDVDPNKKNLIYLSNIFAYNFVIHTKKIKEIHEIFQSYLKLPNTTVYGKNVFKDTVLCSYDSPKKFI